MAGSSGKLNSCEQLFDIAKCIPVGLMTVDRELKVSWYNEVWAERFNKYSSRAIAEGIPFSSLMHDESIEKMLAQALSGKNVESYCHRFAQNHPGGEEKYYDFFARPVTAKNGQTVGALLTAVDVTERYRRIHGLEMAKNEAEFYVDLMSHDIRNFNQITMGYIELLQIADSYGDTERAFLEKAQKGVQGSNKLIDNIKKIRIIRQFAGKTLVETDLNEILEKDARETEKAFPKARISLSFDRGVKRLVLADDYINEIFRHVMENAVKYDQHEEKLIDVGIEPVRRDGRDYWRIGIADHGMGVPEDKKKSIFERMSTTTKGAGVGLSIVSVLVRKYGGRIWAEDRVEGDSTQGSIFYVELPKA